MRYAVQENVKFNISGKRSCEFFACLIELKAWKLHEVRWGPATKA